ncbi:type I methionyl aminopeptidase [Streptobacillus moniliformis]|uniref:type I methionyl aminopeptidase n=1 Tax=Streptobacillus moniliformis TaxID=34105 RepID=UPI0007E40E2F|nr:type I methionyl aminopeptidase [Streptobacillus moniliformis]
MVKLKTLEDIKKIKKANEIIARLYEDIISKYIKPGISTWEIDAICEDYIMSQGAIPGTKGYDIGWPYTPYPASTCISINEKVVHGIPSKTEILKEGDILSLDTVTILNGYFGDAAKTFAVGNIDDKSRKLIEVTEKAREIGIEQARVGNRIGDIGFAIQQYVEKFGFSVVRDFSGHGVGFAMHEDPYVLNYGKANTGLKIENGLVIAIEPMVNIGTFKVKILKDMWTVVTQDKKRSAHFEHSVAIVDGKPLILSQK